MPKRVKQSTTRKQDPIESSGPEASSIADNSQQPSSAEIDQKTKSDEPNELSSTSSKPTQSSTSTMPVVSPFKRLGLAFFDQPCIDLAKSLLGKLLVRKIVPEGAAVSILLASRIVETESYPGADDRGSCTYQGRRTERNAGCFMSPGTTYVYTTYGMYECMNISSGGEGSAVLIRAAEPILGVEYMKDLRRRLQRGKKRKVDVSDSVDSTVPMPASKEFTKSTDICGGPSKLCMAMAIKRDMDKMDLITDDTFYVADDGYGEVDEKDIVQCARIGINNAGVWSTKPLRFYIRDSEYVV